MLTDVDLKIEPGKLHIVIGSVGSGKTSLLGAALGDTKVIGNKEGDGVHVNGTMVYTSQQAWLLNDSLKENVVFGHSYVDEARYNEAIKVCSLTRDIKDLPAGDK